MMILIFKNFCYLKIDSRTSLMVQQLRLCAGVTVRKLTSHVHRSTNSNQKIDSFPLCYFTGICV